MLQILEIITIFILPVALIYFKIIPYRFRLWLLGLMSLAVAIIIATRNWSLEKIGLRFDNFSNTWSAYLLFTGASLLLLFIIIKATHRKANPNWQKSKHFLGLFIPVSFLQEFIYRGFLIPELYNITHNPYIIILINAFLFTLIHLVYKIKIIDFLLIFLAGLALASIYIYYPNLILIGISHSILNFYIVFYGFYSEERN